MLPRFGGVFFLSLFICVVRYASYASTTRRRTFSVSFQCRGIGISKVPAFFCLTAVGLDRDCHVPSTGGFLRPAPLRELPSSLTRSYRVGPEGRAEAEPSVEGRSEVDSTLRPEKRTHARPERSICLCTCGLDLCCWQEEGILVEYHVVITVCPGSNYAFEDGHFVQR